MAEQTRGAFSSASAAAQTLTFSPRLPIYRAVLEVLARWGRLSCHLNQTVQRKFQKGIFQATKGNSYL